MTTTDMRHPHKIFNTKAEAEDLIKVMGLEDGETRINVDPKGSGRCFIEILDIEDGEVIGHI